MELKGSKGSFTYDICLKIKKFKPPLQNAKDIRFFQNHPGIICKQSLKVI